MGRLLTALGFALVASPLTLACGESGPPPPRQRPPARVQVVTPTPRNLPRTLSSVGSLESPEMTTVAAEIAGRITALDIPEGQRVEAGHVLARIDDAETRAALRVAAAQRTNARDRLKRLENLRAESVSSEQAYDDARTEHDAAIGAFEEAQTWLDKTTITAPFTGVLGLRQVNIGEYVEAATWIVELTQVDPLELIFSIPQRFAGELAVGQAVIGRVGSCGPRFEGAVTAIDPRVDPSTRSVRLQARIPNLEGALYPGMAATLQLVVGEIPDAIVVPQEAIVRQGTKHLVFVVDAEGRAEQRRVELGRFFVDGVHIRSGIEPGATVVAAGQQKLRPGSAVETEPFEPVHNPNLELGSDGAAASCEPRS
jgi:membrane fusion protein (multidrug efflux system)